MRSSGFDGPKLLIGIDGQPLLVRAVRVAHCATSGSVYAVAEDGRTPPEVASALVSECCDVIVAKSRLPATTAYAGIEAACARHIAILSGDTLMSVPALRSALTIHECGSAASTVVVAKQAVFTDSEWTVDSDEFARLHIRPSKKRSQYERVAWLIDRETALNHRDLLMDDLLDGRGPHGFEQGSVNWLIDALARRDVMTIVHEVRETVVNVNRVADVTAAASLVAQHQDRDREETYGCPPVVSRTS
jgi:hypothetical protein